MALYNEILVGRYTKFFNKLFSIKGTAAVPQLAGEISPAVQFFMGVENRALEGWYRFGFSVQIGAGGVSAGFRFRNPANSNRICVIEKLVACGVQAVNYIYQVETQTIGTDLSAVITPTNAVAWDKRLNVGSAMVGSSQASPAALAFGRFNYATTQFQTAEMIIEEQHEQVLSPGEAIQIRSLLTGDFHASIGWRERSFEESEASL